MKSNNIYQLFILADLNIMHKHIHMIQWEKYCDIFLLGARASLEHALTFAHT